MGMILKKLLVGIIVFSVCSQVVAGELRYYYEFNSVDARIGHENPNSPEAGNVSVPVYIVKSDSNGDLTYKVCFVRSNDFASPSTVAQATPHSCQNLTQAEKLPARGIDPFVHTYQGSNLNIRWDIANRSLVHSTISALLFFLSVKVGNKQNAMGTLGSGVMFEGTHHRNIGFTVYLLGLFPGGYGAYTGYNFFAEVFAPYKLDDEELRFIKFKPQNNSNGSVDVIQLARPMNLPKLLVTTQTLEQYLIDSKLLTAVRPK